MLIILILIYRFLFIRQLANRNKELVLHFGRRGEGEANAYSIYFYSQLLQVISNKLFEHGTWHYVTVSGGDSWRVVCWQWTLNAETAVVVVNYTDTAANVFLHLVCIPSGNSKGNVCF